MDVLGTRLGRYDIRERLGKGGMAAVYKAWDANLDRWVAIKVLHDYLAEEKDFKARFEREAKFVASLSHPNIVQVYDFDTIERSGTNIYYMVMAYIAGSSLKGIMDQYHSTGAHMMLPEIEKVMQGVCSALSYAHKRGMIHRDVTPSNILFNEQGQAVLADFGIARMVSATRLTQTGTTTGTPVYMSPEQGMGDPGDHRSDIYSLGIILYEMLSGKAPYDGDSAFAVIMKHVQEPIPPLTTDLVAPRPMEAVLNKALAKNPDDRYQDIASFQMDFEQAAGTKTLVRTPPVDRVVDHSHDSPATIVLPTTSVTNPVRRPLSRSLLVTLIGLVAVVIIIGVALIMQINPISSNAAPPPATLKLAKPALKTQHVAPSMTNSPIPFVDHFDPKDPNRANLIWPLTVNDPDQPQVYRNMEDSIYRVWQKLPATALTTIFYEEIYYPFHWQYTADMTLSDKSQRDSAAGIVFRYRDDDNYYVFGVNGLGQVSVWLRSNGDWKELRDQSMTWTDAKGVNPVGKLNHLVLIDDAKEIRGYANGNLVIDVKTEPLISSGAIGLYLATTSDPKISSPYAEVDVSSFSAQPYQATTDTPLAPTQPTF